MNIAILSRAYPTPENKYNYTFVHRRATRYNETNEVNVYVPNDEIEIAYDFEDVSVTVSNQDDIVERIASSKPDALFVHTPISKWLSLSFDMLEIAKQVYERGVPYAVWIHGHEALLKQLYHPPEQFEGLPKSPYEVLWVVRRALQLYEIRNFLRYSDRRGLPTVFVSEWLRKSVEKSLLMKIDNYRIIPNPIDGGLFQYKENDGEKANELLSIRPFRPKYANKQTIRAVAEVDDVHLDLYGKGPMKDELQQLADQLDANVDIHEEFFTQDEIASLHRDYGVYVTPTKSDAQGVSMCEAMSSGIPVISSPVQAIPEFVVDGETGFLCDGPPEIAEKIRYFRDNPQSVIKMGKRASEFIREKSGADYVVEQDLSVAKSLVRTNG
jgi:glycosyltransferase involved in cell wall biosynthesis